MKPQLPAVTIAPDLAQRILRLVASVSETEEVQNNLDLSLFDHHVLDSMKTVQLIVAIEEEFGVQVSPAELDRESWATPRKILTDVERRIVADIEKRLQL